MDCIKQTTHLTGLYPLPLLENLEKQSRTNQPNKEEIEKSSSDCWPNPDDLDFDQTMMMIWTTSNWICIQVFLAPFNLNLARG